MLLDAASRIASRIRCIQKVAHFSFHTCFGGKAGKYDRQAVDKKLQTEKNKDSVQAKHFSSEKKELHHKCLPLSNCLFWSVDHAFITCYWPNSSLSDSSPVAACEGFALLLSSIPTSC